MDHLAVLVLRDQCGWHSGTAHASFEEFPRLQWIHALKRQNRQLKPFVLTYLPTTHPPPPHTHGQTQKGSSTESSERSLGSPFSPTAKAFDIGEELRAL